MAPRPRGPRLRPRGLRRQERPPPRRPEPPQGGGAAPPHRGAARRGRHARPRFRLAHHRPSPRLRGLPGGHQSARSPPARGDGTAPLRSLRHGDAVLLSPRSPHRLASLPQGDQARAPPHMVTPPPLLVICGPTGVGKTPAAVHLAARLAIEVVSADSRQVYRGMEAATGKPTAAERAAVPHHLLDLIEPSERYHAARFRREALACIDAIRGRGKLPVVVGGTGLYIRALLRGLDPAPPADPALRSRLQAMAADAGVPALHARLASLDREAAARLHPNDLVRIIRAIEKHELGGGRSGARASWSAAVPPWRLLLIGLGQERSALNRHLEERAHGMLSGGMM